MKPTNEIESSSTNSGEKQSWVKPEVIDIDINEATQGATGGPSGGDGGPFNTDYNS